MQKILVGFEATREGRDALRLAMLVRSLSDAELIVAAIYEAEPAYGDIGGWQRNREDYCAETFAAAEKMLGDVSYARRSSFGSVPSALDRLAETEAADLIVVGSTHRGKLGQVLPGSVGERLLHGAPCAVAIAPIGYGDHEHAPVQRVGLGYDGGLESRVALDTAIVLAHRLDAQLRLIAVVPPAPGPLVPGAVPTPSAVQEAVRRGYEARLAEAVATITDDVEVDVVLGCGDPAHELTNQGVELELLVLGSRGYGPLKRVLLGGVAGGVIGLAPCPVIVVPRGVDRVSAAFDEPQDKRASA